MSYGIGQVFFNFNVTKLPDIIDKSKYYFYTVRIEKLKMYVSITVTT